MWTSLLIISLILSFGLNFALAQPNDGILTEEEARVKDAFANRFSSLERFGHAVAVDASHILIGADRKDIPLSDAGAAYLYDLESGVLLNRFFSPNPASLDLFGFSVALGGGYAFIGAFGVDMGGPDVGAVFQFEINTGILVRVIENPTPEGGDQFGRAIALYDDKLLVGALSDNTAGPDAGAAYLMDINSGELMLTFLNPSPGRGDWFGHSLAIYEDSLVIGAEKDGDIFVESGATYLFDGSTGELLRTFLPTNPHNGGRFGHSLAIDARRIAIGADNDHAAVEKGGAVYLFDSYLSESSTILLPPMPAAEDRFGRWVALSDPYLIVGADLQDTQSLNSGAIYQFRIDSGELVRTILNPVRSENDRFGHTISISKDNLLVGTEYGGAAYLFYLEDGDMRMSFLDPDPQSPAKGFPVLGIGAVTTFAVIMGSLVFLLRRRSHQQ